MPWPSNHVPKYQKHRASGQAVVTINYVDHYLGPHNSKASVALYDRLIAEYLASGRQAAPQQPAEQGMVVVQVLAAYWKHCKSYYVKDGKPTKEQAAFRTLIRDVRKLYGSEPVKDFGPRALKAIRQTWIDRGHKRKIINANVHRVRRMFCWAASEEIIPNEVYLALKTVTGLRTGRSEAKESSPVLPVELTVVERTMDQLQPIVCDMVRIQLLTGMRPEEVCYLCPCDLDRSGDVWEYKPSSHKMQHHGRKRVIFIGPEAQAIMRPYLLRDAKLACFSPAENVDVWLQEKSANRTTAESCGNRPGSNRKAKPQHAPR